MVQEFPDIFTENLPSLALEQKVEFSIELVLSTTLIPKAPYKMVLAELQELKK